MARMARFKAVDAAAWYHIHSRVAGCRGEFPLSEPLPRRRLMELLQYYCTTYFCQVAALSVMGTHYHVVVHFDKPTIVPRKELERRAHSLYPSKTSRRVIALWSDEQWERFRERLFNVSELMRNIQSAFARWYNETYDRRGTF